MHDYFVGLDLGQARDYSAIVVVERVDPGVVARLWSRSAYHVRLIERPKLRTPYPVVVARVRAILDRLGSEAKTLVVDATGVGRAVVDLFVAEGIDPVAVTITGGDSVTNTAGGYRVPKRDLVGVLDVLLQSGRLKIASALRESGVLVEELLAFRANASATGHDTYAAGAGTHDDLVLALALACWRGHDTENCRVTPPVLGISEPYEPDPDEAGIPDDGTWVLGPGRPSLPLKPYTPWRLRNIPGAGPERPARPYRPPFIVR